VTKPGSESAVAFAILGLALAGAVLGYGLGRQATATSDEPAAPTVKLSLPPSTVIHPPIVCHKDVCEELRASARYAR
jgi:hypothetical protein